MIRSITMILICLILFPLGISCERNVEAANSDNIEANGERSYELTGQIFAIQKNRVNVKLGDVPVYYVDGSTFDARLAWISEKLNRARAVYNYLEKLEVIESSAARPQIRNSAFDNNEALLEISNFVISARERLHLASVVTELLELNRKAENNYASGLENAAFDVDSWFVSAIFGDWLESKAFAISRTDADGVFRMSVPISSKGYLFARSSREVFESNPEIYHWIYEVDGAVTTPVLLTTNNLLNSQQIGVFADQFRAATPYSEEMLVSDNGLLEVDWVGDVRTILSEVETLTKQIESNNSRINELRAMIQDEKE